MKGKNQHIALLTDKEEISYDEMIEQADALAHQIPTRSLVLFAAANTTEAVIAYVGFLRKAVVPIMVNRNISADDIESLIGIYRPEYVWCSRESVGSLSVLASHGEFVLCETGIINSENIHDDLALLLTTSGSTGSKKYVRLSYRNLLSNAQSILLYLDIKPDDRAITTLPFSYSYGLSIINSHLLAKATLILTERTLFEREFWALLNQREATTFGGVPYTYEMLRRLHFDRMEIPSIRYITQAGGRLSEEMHSEFLETCSTKGIEFFVMYGQTEATARMTYLPPTQSREKIGSIGVAIPGGSIELIDDSGKIILEPDIAGEMLYRGENVSMGYAECRGDLEKGDERRGVLNTGDIAVRDKEGFYRIVGRKKRFLKIFGNRVNLDEIDILLKEEGFSAVCSGKDDAMRVFVEAGSSEAVQEYLVEKTGLHKSAFKIVSVESIPRNEAGKILYSELVEPC